MIPAIDLWANFLAHEKLYPNQLQDRYVPQLIQLAEALAAKEKPKLRPYSDRIATRWLLCKTAMDLGIDLPAIMTKGDYPRVAMGRGLLDVWNKAYRKRFGSTIGTASALEAKRRDVKTKLNRHAAREKRTEI